MEEKKEVTPAVGAVANSSTDMPVPKIKHDWYQTEPFVIVTVLVKNLKQEDVKVDFTEKTVSALETFGCRELSNGRSDIRS